MNAYWKELLSSLCLTRLPCALLRWPSVECATNNGHVKPCKAAHLLDRQPAISLCANFLATSVLFLSLWFQTALARSRWLMSSVEGGLLRSWLTSCGLCFAEHPCVAGALQVAAGSARRLPLHAPGGTGVCRWAQQHEHVHGNGKVSGPS